MVKTKTQNADQESSVVRTGLSYLFVFLSQLINKFTF